MLISRFLRPSRALSLVATATAVVIALALLALPVEAAAVPTAATGGGAISVDTPATATTPAWTTLTGPIVITEGLATDIAVQAAVTMIFSAPAGFEFNTAIVVDVVGAGADLTAIDAGVTYPSGTQMQFAYTAAATASSDTITIGGVTAI